MAADMNQMRLRTRRGVRRRNHRRGAAAVEFALAAPILFTVLFAALEFGRINMIRQTANNAAYAAVRQSVVPGATAAEAQAAAQAILDSIGVAGATISITPSTIVSTTPEVTAQVSVPISGNMWLQPIYTTATSINVTCRMTRDWILSTRQTSQ